VKLGTEGNDSLNGGGGEDYVYGNAGDDSLRGGGDSDLIRAGEGNDRVDGGGGDDGLYGGDGADVFVVSGGSDLLQDFESGIDRIKVASATINSFAQLAITQDRRRPDGGRPGSRSLSHATPTNLTAPIIFT
jgi:Ca2+-binding RTX toxin-like protein